jgi:hypothetical protein
MSIAPASHAGRKQGVATHSHFPSFSWHLLFLLFFLLVKKQSGNAAGAC